MANDFDLNMENKKKSSTEGVQDSNRVSIKFASKQCIDEKRNKNSELIDLTLSESDL